MLLHFVLDSGKIVTLGTLLPVSKDILNLYVKKYPRHWITV